MQYSTRIIVACFTYLSVPGMYCVGFPGYFWGIVYVIVENSDICLFLENRQRTHYAYQLLCALHHAVCNTYITDIPSCSKFKKTDRALICFGSFTTHFGGILLF
jgi:hypothetical protein